MEKEIPRANMQYINEIEQLVENIKIKSDSSFILNDQIYETSGVTEEIVNETNVNLSKNNLTLSLANSLYQLIHCRKALIDEQISSYHDSLEGSKNRNFLELLSKANHSVGNWEPGWIVFKIEKNSKIVIKKNDLMIWAMPYQFIPLNGKLANIGDEGCVAMVKEFRELFPGFYMVNGNISIEDKSFIVRIYWNISSDGAVSLVKSLTNALNDEGIPFQFKILNNEKYYVRADAGVLYLDKDDIKDAKNALSAIYNNIKSFLKPSVPLFAKKLASGISLAEDPANGESFGQNRCRLFAESIYDAYTKDISKLKEKIEHVKEYFEIQDINFNIPYLKNTKSSDDYDILYSVFE